MRCHVNPQSLGGYVAKWIELPTSETPFFVLQPHVFSHLISNKKVLSTMELFRFDFVRQMSPEKIDLILSTFTLVGFLWISKILLCKTYELLTGKDLQSFSLA